MAPLDIPKKLLSEAKGEEPMPAGEWDAEIDKADLEDVATFLSGDGDANPMMPEFMPESNGAATIGLDAATPER